MHVLVYSVFDIKAKQFQRPFYSLTRGTAIRDFQDAVNDPQTSLNKYPDDFTLFEIGTFDDTNGELIPHETKQAVGNALEYLTSKKED